MNVRKLQLWLIDLSIIVGLTFIYWCGMSGLTAVRQPNAQTLICAAAFSAAILGMRMAIMIYRIVWRYSTTWEYSLIVLSDALATTVLVLMRMGGLDMGMTVVQVIGTVFSIDLCTLVSRFMYKLYHDYMRLHRLPAQNDTRPDRTPIAIVGAGNVGAMLAGELMGNPQSPYQPYCFVDTNPQKYGGRVMGINVWPDDDGVIERLRESPVQKIVIAISSLNGEAMQTLYKRYSRIGCDVNIYDFPLSGSAKDMGEREIREFAIEDLLFRDTVAFDLDEQRAAYEGRVVMVTGGGGSIGSELCRQLARLGPKRLIIFDIYENNAYDIQQELGRIYGDKLDVEVEIGSVRDVKRLEYVFMHQRPEIVFHAAAHKHVPLMEHSCGEAIKNNVLGTLNTANMAEKYGVERFLLVSTDKAVNPTNVMGASKRMCEMIIQSKQSSRTKFVAVRFGNVLGSNGSVVPLFRRQIQSGGPITITDKRIIRYFMTIPEAAQLLLQTCSMASSGEIYVLDMGKPVKILDLAEKMVSLSGLKPYIDINIVECGLRPGEKLYEELLMRTEHLDKTKNRKIFIEKDEPITPEELTRKISILFNAVESGSQEGVKHALHEVVDTYHEPDAVNAEAAACEEMQMAT